MPNRMIIKGDKYLKLTRICVISPQIVYFFLDFRFDFINVSSVQSKLIVCFLLSPKLFFPAYVTIV